MKIKEIKENKKQFLPLLLLADEQEDMIDRYLNRGIMYVLDDDGVKCECVVTVSYTHLDVYMRQHLYHTKQGELL